MAANAAAVRLRTGEDLGAKPVAESGILSEVSWPNFTAPRPSKAKLMQKLPDSSMP